MKREYKKITLLILLIAVVILNINIVSTSEKISKQKVSRWNYFELLKKVEEYDKLRFLVFDDTSKYLGKINDNEHLIQESNAMTVINLDRGEINSKFKQTLIMVVNIVLTAILIIMKKRKKVSAIYKYCAVSILIIFLANVVGINIKYDLNLEIIRVSVSSIILTALMFINPAILTVLIYTAGQRRIRSEKETKRLC